MIAYIANTILLVFILLVVILVRFNKEEDPDLSGQSERQKENNDYNDNYH